MTYTKGPWAVTRWNNRKGFNVFGEDGFVASVPMDVGLKHTLSESEANANLIAAAPAMYEALKGLRIAYNVDGERDSIADDPIYWQRAVQALAQAEGKREPK